MRIIIAVPYGLETSGSITFGLRLCSALAATSHTVTVAFPGSHQGTSALAEEFSLMPRNIKPFGDNESLMNWLQKESSTADVIFWAGIFQDESSRRRQINDTVSYRKQGVKVVYLWERTGQTSVIPERRLFRLLINEAADVISVLNRAHRTLLIERGMDPSRVKLFTPGVDTSNNFLIPQPERKRQLKEQWNCGNSDSVFLVLSRWVVRKRIDFVIKSWLEHFPDDGSATLLIVGTGFGAADSNEHQLNQLAKGSDSIRLVRFEKGMEHREFYFAADVFVTASSMEGEPTALHEAMASGLPVIASDIPGHQALVEHGKTGFLFPQESSEKFAECVRALTGDSLQRRQLSDEARISLVKKRDINVIAEKFLSLIGNTSKPPATTCLVTGDSELSHQIVSGFENSQSAN